uniref:Uncharacterized protein n=1 Tax=Tanacetum cinerariifolium TaxID=118510 RepID=A0A6L2MGI2_TANCI|nr:hypothetical protein [Tanacetum cinerariifolium]
MVTTIEQQVALDEALIPAQKAVPYSRRSLLLQMYQKFTCRNFRPPLMFINTPSDSNWTTKNTSHQQMPNWESFGFDSFRISQAQTLWGLYHSKNIDYAFLIWKDFMYQVEQKNQKKSNEMYYPRFIKVVSRHQNTQQYGAVLPIELMNKEIRNTMAYKEYYACATEEAAPKPKASARRKRSGSDTSITPPTAITTRTTTGAVTPRLTTAIKGKQPAKAKSPFDPSEHDDKGDEKDESDDGEEDDDDDKDADESDDDDDDDEEIAKIDVHDDPERGGDDDEESKNDEESADEETREEESFDPIPRTPKNSEDDGNGEEDQGLQISGEERIHEEEEADELYRDVKINQGRGLQVSQDIEDSHMTLTPFHPDGQQESSSMSSQFMTMMLNPISDVGMESIFVTASSSLAPLPTPTPTMTPSIITTITTTSNPPIPPTPIPSEVLQHLLTFDSVSSHSSRTSYVVAADLSKMELKKILIEKMEGNQSIQCSDEQRNLYKALVEAYKADKIILDTYGERVILKRRCDDNDDQEELVQTTSQIEEPSPLVFETDCDWNKTLPAVQGSAQTWIRELAKQADSRSSFNEFLDTPIDFSNFIMNRLEVDTLTPKLLAGPTYELMKGTCKSLTELEYHLEEVYKATTYQLDWFNPEGQQYPYNLLQPIPLIPNNRGRHVIPFSHFINNDLKYLQGGTSSRKYTTSVTKTKAADYGNIKWIEDLRRIIAVTDLKIVEWHNYKHLDWISVRHDDDKIYKFKEGDFKRLRLQDIEDMLLLLVQGNLYNLTVE